jgi:hypothetical protein
MLVLITATKQGIIDPLAPHDRRDVSAIAYPQSEIRIYPFEGPASHYRSSSDEGSGSGVAS